MDIKRVKYLGEFDKVYTVGYMTPSCRQHGVEIVDDQFKDSIKNHNDFPLQAIDSCTIQLIGEYNLGDWDKDETQKSRRNRQIRNIRPLQLDKNGVDRYIIGYITVLIFDGSKLSMNDYFKRTKLTVAAKQQDEVEMFEYLNSYIPSQESFGKKNNRVGLIDRMYVGEAFRGNGVGAWLIDNLRDLIEFYSKVKLDSVVLEAGDFANEQKTKFNVDRDEYVEKLEKFYSSHGFKQVKGNIIKALAARNQGLDRYMYIKY